MIDMGRNDYGDFSGTIMDEEIGVELVFEVNVDEGQFYWNEARFQLFDEDHGHVEGPVTYEQFWDLTSQVEFAIEDRIYFYR